MTPITGAAIGNHLWQSTLFVGVAWLLTLALRKNRASLRYWIWFAASMKFLVPLSLFVGLGGYVQLPKTPEIVKSNFFFIESVGRPIVAPASDATAATSAYGASLPVNTPVLPWLVMGTWFAGFTAVALNQYLRRRRFRTLIDKAQFFREGREVEALRRVQSRRGCRDAIHLASSSSTLEPGVRGIFTHLLLLPADISTRLDNAQLEAILDHEVAHIERRDNLLAAIHMMVETLFWFHPLVWWIGSRMVEERERACDGSVLQSGNDAEAYAGAILKVCQYYLASPLTTISGISGSNLRKRIEDIMTNNTGEKLDGSRKLLLAAAVTIVSAAPILAGVMYRAQPALQISRTSTPAFEAASVKLNMSGGQPFRTQFLPNGRFVATNVPLAFLIMTAYDMPPQQLAFSAELQRTGDRQVMAGRYDIEGVASKDFVPAGSPAKLRDEKLRLMVQSVLAERFKLIIHREVKDQPVYAMVVGKGGPKLEKAAIDENNCADQPTDPLAPTSCHMFRGGLPTGLDGQSVEVSDFVKALTGFSDRVIVDKTGIHGLYHIRIPGWVDIRNVPRTRPAGTDGQRIEDQLLADPNRPTLFAALEALGLKLEAQTGPVETVYIDHIEAPAEN